MQTIDKNSLPEARGRTPKEPTLLQRHFAECKHCGVTRLLCETGGRILRRGMQQELMNQAEDARDLIVTPATE